MHLKNPNETQTAILNFRLSWTAVEYSFFFHSQVSDTQTHRHTDTQTHRHTDTQTHRHTDTQTHSLQRNPSPEITDLIIFTPDFTNSSRSRDSASSKSVSAHRRSKSFSGVMSLFNSCAKFFSQSSVSRESAGCDPLRKECESEAHWCFLATTWGARPARILCFD
jgi:hypothetical protein